MYRLTPLPPTHSLPVPEGPARVQVEAVLLLADGGEPLPPTSSPPLTHLLSLKALTVST